MSTTLVKWVKAPDQESATRIIERLKLLHEARPLNLAPLYSWGQTPTSLRLEFALVRGIRADLHSKKLLRKHRSEIIQSSFAVLARWKKIGFVHGDLSPRNLLIDLESPSPTLHFIDPLLDLCTFSGTPLFMDPSILKTGKRSFSTDCFSINQSLKHLGLSLP